MKFSTTVMVILAGLPLATPALAAQDKPDASPVPTQDSNFNQCDPACVAPEVCCALSALESACVDPGDCFRKKQKQQKNK